MPNDPICNVFFPGESLLIDKFKIRKCEKVVSKVYNCYISKKEERIVRFQL